MLKRKLYALILAVIMIASSSLSTAAGAFEYNKIKALIDPALETLLQSAPSNKRIPVDIWFYETETMEERESAILTKIGINKRQIAIQEKDVDIVTAEKVDEYIETERTLYAKNRKEQYALLLKDYEKMDGLKETREEKRLFFSQYAPLISAELTPSEIKTLARDERVHSIYYSPDVTFVENSNVAAQVTATNYTRDTLGYTGSGIKIGMIERWGLPDTNQEYFNSATIIYDPNAHQGYNATHANQVAAIMVGSPKTINGITYKGIVPNATLYATNYENFYDGETDWRERVEWLISQGVHVINMSASIEGEGVFAGAYGNYERWVDHVAISHSVHFVVSAGNTSSSVTCPALAYNVITVGAIDDNDNTAHFDDYVVPYSSYLEAASGTAPNKPDLLAPGENIATAATTDSGTSFAAPQVTAIVAQLCQYRPALKTLQDAMKAILTASISHEYLAFDSSNENASDFEQGGAGVVNAKDSFYTAGNGRYLTADFPANSAANSERRYTLYVSPSDTKIRVSLTWLKYSTLSGTHATVTTPTDYAIADLDLYILDPNGNYIDLAVSSENNVEIIDFTPQGSGNYTILIRHVTGSPRATYYALAWW